MVDPSAAVRRLSLYNLNTQERLQLDYWVEGRYDVDALRTLNHFLRDHRDGSIHAMDPRLMDLLYGIFRLTGASSAIDVICGYRSPRTNALMHASHGGVAGHSLHMQGKAVDIRVGSCGLSALHGIALALRAGGVGYYPRSDFVHVDTGPVRSWGGHGLDEEYDEAPAWRDALLSEPSGTDRLPGGGEPVSTLEAVAPRGRRMADLATGARPPGLPGHKPVRMTRMAMHDPAPVRSESFWVRRKPHLAGG